MIILDTSIWIEYLRNNKEYFPKIRSLLENREVLAVECVFGELLQGTKNKKEREIILDWNAIAVHTPRLASEKCIIWYM